MRAGRPVRKRASTACALHADDRIVRAGHADVGDVGRAAGQHARVGGLHVRVGADDGRDPAVEVPAHRDLLGGRLRVHVHDDDAALVARARSTAAATAANGLSTGGMNTRPITLMTPTGRPSACAADERAAARARAAAMFSGPQQARLGADVGERLASCPRRDCRWSSRRRRTSSSASPVSRVMPDAGRGVLDVGDDEIDGVAGRERGQRLAHQVAPGPAEDVADEQDAHDAGTRCRGRSGAGPRRTWTAMSRPRRSSIFGTRDAQLAAGQRGRGARRCRRPRSAAPPGRTARSRARRGGSWRRRARPGWAASCRRR